MAFARPRMYGPAAGAGRHQWSRFDADRTRVSAARRGAVPELVQIADVKLNTQVTLWPSGRPTTR